MKKTTIRTAALCVICLLVGGMIGMVRGTYSARMQLLELAANVDGREGGNQIRHKVIGVVTNVLIAPDRVEIHGLNGSRIWFP